MSTVINTQLIDSIAQVILALTPEQQKLLSQTVQKFQPAFPSINPVVEQFFQEMENLEPDPDGISLQEITQEVKAVREELWTQS